MTLGALAGRGVILEGLAAGPPPTDTLAEQVVSAYTDAGWVCPYLFLAASENVTEVSGAVSAWANLGSAGGTASQGTASLRPVYSATGLNSNPALSFDGGDSLTGTSFNASAYPAAALTVIFQDTDTTLAYPAEFGNTSTSGNGSVGLLTNFFFANDAGRLAAFSQFQNRLASSVGSFPMTSPDVVSVTADLSLSAGSRLSVRHASIDVGANRSEAGASGLMGTHSLLIGDRTTGGRGITGEIAAVCLAFGPSPVPTATVAAVEALLAAEWGV